MVAKKSARIDKKKEDVTDMENKVKVYERQKGVKEVFLTKVNQENESEKKNLAKQLAKKVRVKTGSLLKFYKDEYWSDEMSAYRGQPNLAATVVQEYNQYMEQYHKKIQKLSETMERYRDIKQQSEQLDSVNKNVGRETQLWRKMGEGQKRKNLELSKKCDEVQKDLKKEAHMKDELAELLARTERRAAENEKFRQQAEAAVNSASEYKNFMDLLNFVYNYKRMIV